MVDNMIYESPDGGDTVYVRDSVSGERRLHSISEKKARLDTEQKENQVWEKICRDAAHDPVLKDMLEQVKVYWTLRYTDK